MHKSLFLLCILIQFQLLDVEALIPPQLSRHDLSCTSWKDTKVTVPEEIVGDSGITVRDLSVLSDMTGDVTTLFDLPFLVALGMLAGNDLLMKNQTVASDMKT